MGSESTTNERGISMDLHIDNNWKRIGVRLSGGADSSIIYYSLCKHFLNTDTKIIPLTMTTPRNWWYSKGAQIVIDRVDELLGTKTTEHYVYQDQTPHTDESYVAAVDHLSEQAHKKYNLDAIYIGLTRNPPAEEMREYFTTEFCKTHNLNQDTVWSYIIDRDTERDDQVEPELLKIYDGKLTQVIPFANLNKVATRQLYDLENIQQELYPYTYSCEKVIPEDSDLTHCGYCFFCLERYWAFGRLV